VHNVYDLLLEEKYGTINFVRNRGLAKRTD